MILNPAGCDHPAVLRTAGGVCLACGQTVRVETKPDIYDDIGPLIPIQFVCRGTYTTFMCDAKICWFSGRYWR